MSDATLVSLITPFPNVRIPELTRIQCTSSSFTPGQTEDSSHPSLPLPLPLDKVLTISHIDLIDQPPYGLLSILGLFSAIAMLRISYVEPP